MRVLVTGSIQWTDAAAIRRELADLPAGTVVIHGDTAGVDALAGEVARELGFAVERFAKAPTDEGPDAWMRLNERMLESGADLVLAFHPRLGEPGQALGSGHLAQLARDRGVEVRGFCG